MKKKYFSWGIYANTNWVSDMPSVLAINKEDYKAGIVITKHKNNWLVNSQTIYRHDPDNFLNHGWEAFKFMSLISHKIENNECCLCN